ncbi:hypothetical protein Anapl_17035 [Anas platyrhynchos]|uniref:Uncharacterized protein n=1 Tax=Anas platyrhynchos TaxID=8839 RepID=R0LCA4_ANAPL|nr:hypothetical protein Anapl_17035 [Anas platyrhynchos]
MFKKANELTKMSVQQSVLTAVENKHLSIKCLTALSVQDEKTNHIVNHVEKVELEGENQVSVNSKPPGISFEGGLGAAFRIRPVRHTQREVVRVLIQLMCPSGWWLASRTDQSRPQFFSKQLFIGQTTLNVTTTANTQKLPCLNGWRTSNPSGEQATGDCMESPESPLSFLSKLFYIPDGLIVKSLMLSRPRGFPTPMATFPNLPFLY